MEKNPISELNELVIKKTIANIYTIETRDKEFKVTISFDGITSIGFAKRINDAKFKAASNWLIKFKCKN